MSIRARVERLERNTSAVGLDWDKLTDEELGRLEYLHCKLALRGLDDDERAEANGLHGAVGLPPHDTRGPLAGGLSAADQQCIDELAGPDPRYRPWAAKRTWADCFYTTKVVSRWALAVEGADYYAPAVRDKAGALLRRRWRCLPLQRQEVEWLIAALKDFDLGTEGPWLRDHLEGTGASDGMRETQAPLLRGGRQACGE